MTKQLQNMIQKVSTLTANNELKEWENFEFIKHLQIEMNQFLSDQQWIKAFDNAYIIIHMIENKQ